MGDTRASLQALDAVRRHVEAITDPPQGTDFFDGARLDRWKGLTGPAGSSGEPRTRRTSVR